jgi:hypothetical protein
MFGQLAHYERTETIIKKNAISSPAGKIQDKNAEKDMVTKEVTDTGTYYFLFDVTNFTNKKEITGTSIQIGAISSSKKIFQMYSQPMMCRFSDSFSLDENRGYLFTPNFNSDMSFQTMKLKYKVE